MFKLAAIVAAAIALVTNAPAGAVTSDEVPALGASSTVVVSKSGATVVKNGPGRLFGVMVTEAYADHALTCYDSERDAKGTIIFAGSQALPIGSVPLAGSGIPFAHGLVCKQGETGAATLSYR